MESGTGTGMDSAFRVGDELSEVAGCCKELWNAVLAIGACAEDWAGVVSVEVNCDVRPGDGVRITDEVAISADCSTGGMPSSLCRC